MPSNTSDVYSLRNGGGSTSIVFYDMDGLLNSCMVQVVAACRFVVPHCFVVVHTGTYK